ncbi:hypothetical protein FB451DRAFT_1273504 [Mycena latifolia]|nr:hypothetical protein FB451DRAFT_1273504 [Mycena latifolia]
MATTSPIASATSTSPTSSCTLGAASCGLPSAGTLYLFTFLSTLLLLTAVAGAIVSRSVYLRRRQRQLIASGRWPPSRAKPEVNLKKRPQIFEAGLSGVVPANDLGHWDVIMPISVAYTPGPAPLEPPNSETLLNDGPSPPPTTGAGIFARRWRGLQPSNVIKTPPAPVPETIPLADPTPSKLPEPEKSAKQEGDEEPDELPFFEFGIAEVDVVRSSDEDELLEDGGKGKHIGENADSSSST